MMRKQNPNLDILTAAVHRLGPLADSMVFLGGCATGLLITDPAAPLVRTTVDVDVIVEVASLVQYHRLSNQLREQGLFEDTSSDAPICRWRAEGVILDLMPTNPQILGFANSWYSPAFAKACRVVLPSGEKIRMVTAPYFMATKLEAFHGRGNGDYLLSHDVDDIVAVIDGRPEIVDEIQQSEKDIREYLAEQFGGLLNSNEFLYALPGHLPSDKASQERLPLVMGRIRSVAKSFFSISTKNPDLV